MQLVLSTEEARELKNAVESDLRMLFDELAHADNREFREELKARIACMQSVERRLGAVLEEGETAFA
jgi:hypothetical protein